MSILSILLIALGLAMDAFAVSVSSGISAANVKPRHAVKLGLFCGVFQFAMPVIGWLLGSALSHLIESVDHWVAFVLLGFIGGRMIWGALRKDDGDDKSAAADEVMSNKRLTVLAIATSIDALAVGVSFALLDVNIWLSSAVIGVVAFALSFIGCLLGKKLGAVVREKAELLGGIVLVGIGLKILIEHLFFH